MKRIIGLDLARILSVIGIIGFHFYSYSISTTKIIYAYANGQWGGTLNALFFALSGLLLHLKYREKLGSIKNFYLKGWKAVIPAYVIAFLFLYLINVSNAGTFFYLDIPKWILLLSFCGFDGYAQWFMSTYFIVGVWFVGAIIFLYILYPLLRILFIKAKIVSYLFIWGSFIFLFFKVNLNSPIGINPITCVLEFTTGMILADCYKKINNVLGIFIGIAVLVLLFIQVPGDHVFKEILTGVLLLLFCYWIGKMVAQKEKVCKIIESVSSCSYEMIVVHLPLIHKVLVGWNSTSTKKEAVVFAWIVLNTFLLGKILHIITKNTCDFFGNVYRMAKECLENRKVKFYARNSH